MTKILNKGETLTFLKKKKLDVNTIIPDLLIFKKKYFLKDNKLIINKIRRKFKKKIIIRSSAIDEDVENNSNAGKYFSCISNLKPDDLLKNINKVCSFLKIDDYFIVQIFISKPKLSGVIFTRCINDNAPYIVINIDYSQKTNLITSGKYNPTMKTYYIHRSLKYVPLKFKKIVKLISSLEKIIKHDRLDIEFAQKGKFIYLFQCRKLLFKKKTISLNSELINIEKKIIKIFKQQPGIFGKHNMLSNMADWNPAEIIGVKPYPLAISLYKEYITDHTWASQRKDFGYRDVSPYPLMYNLGGSPYIDIRIDFNSFLPSNLKEGISEKVINFYIKFLRKNIAYHDKVEFFCLPTFYNFFSKNKLKFLNHNENKDYFSKLKKITIKNLNIELIKNEKDKIKELNAKQLEIENKKISNLQKIFLHSYYCKKKGILPFASIARKAFISKSIFESFLNEKFIDRKIRDNFFLNIKTISKEINKDLIDLRHSKINKVNFLKKYGHLRPSTYDIDSKSYKENFSNYFDLKNINHIKNKNNFFITNKLKKKIKSKMDGIISPKKLIDYIKITISLREEFKLEFTKTIDYTFINLKKIFKDLNISELDIKYIDFKTILTATSELSLTKYRDILLKNIKLNKDNYKKSSLIKLPDTINSSKDIYFFEQAKGKPNFITNKKIMAKIFFIHKQKKLNNLKNLINKIIFIENADPGFDFLFSYNIAGLITKYGGPNSHMAIKCEELNIPAVIGVGNLINNFKNNDTIEINCLDKKIRNI